MFIIFGSKVVEKQKQNGQFHCANCQSEQNYSLVEYKKYFSLFFIPLIPLSNQGEGVKCFGCRQVFVPGSVLQGYVAPNYAIQSADGDKELASVGARIGAYIIDVILLTVLNFPLAILLGMLPESVNKMLGDNFVFKFLIVWLIYFVLTEWLGKGATVGKKILGIRSINLATGQALSFPSYVLRAIFKMIPLLPITALFTEKNRAVHDLVAGSIVVKK